MRTMLSQVCTVAWVDHPPVDIQKELVYRDTRQYYATLLGYSADPHLRACRASEPAFHTS